MTVALCAHKPFSYRPEIKTTAVAVVPAASAFTDRLPREYICIYINRLCGPGARVLKPTDIVTDGRTESSMYVHKVCV